MKLARISSGYWEVLAVCNDSWECPALDQLKALGDGNKNEKSLAAKMLSLMEQWVPNQTNGPQTHNENISKKLSEEVFELKRGQKKGPKIRATYFYAKGKSIVVVNIFLKSDKTPQTEIAQAESMRKEFFDAASTDVEIRDKEDIGYE